MLDEIDEFLEEVDAVLDETVGEETVEHFVRNYIQKGGQ